jgi:hypothetical protein|tara:strand:- start:1420 stop:1653 length:234 start_codon:yes stop_codon:yes gene_type:complete
MAARGSAAKSASGAAMSKYDVEVEARLKALETKAEQPPVIGGATYDRMSELEKRVELLENILKYVEPGYENLVKKFS